ncbi:MAG: hypothetical protein JWL76_2353 [Thermoleophilia bacterium]|nr:hypothetical protein [Thermoleophilia bacterium]
MYLVRSLSLPTRRLVFIALGVVVAMLLAAALVLEPPTRSGSTSDGPRTAGTTTSEPSPNGDAFGSTGGVAERDGADTAIDDVANDAVPGVAGGAPDAAIGIGAEEAAKANATVGPTAPTDQPAIAPATGTIAPAELDSRIIRSGSIELRVKRAGFEDAWGDAQSVASAFGGYVIAASRSGAGGGPRAGTISMRIPTKRFDAAVDRLREVSGAKVRRLDISSQDVTQEFVDVRSRLRHDRAVEGRLLSLLAQTKGVSEVLAVQSRLDQVQEQIELSTGRLEYLEKMTSMSTVEVSITAPAKSGADRDQDSDEPGVLTQSFVDAKDRLEGNVAGAIVWFGGALPALVLLAALAFVGRAIWRRTRPATIAREHDTTAD